MKNKVLNFEEFLETPKKDVPQEGDKPRKKIGDELYLAPDAQNPKSPDDSQPGLAKYPQGGI